MITKREKMLLHLYADAAGLDHSAYVAHLSDETGKSSSADPEFSHADADAMLCRLEAVLWGRVAAGEVPRPVSAWIRDEFHFRRKCSTTSARLTTRQAWKIDTLWTQLGEFLPDPSADYLARIVARAVGRPTSVSLLTQHDAALVITALQDRLRYALAAARRDAETVPF